MTLPHCKRNATMDQMQESRKATHSTESSGLLYAGGRGAFKPRRSSLSEGVLFYENMATKLGFPRSPSYLLDSSPSIITGSMSRSPSGSSCWSLIHDSDSSAASLSHGSSPSDCSSYNLTQVPDIRMESAEAEGFFGVDIQTDVNEWELWGPGNQNMIMEEAFVGKTDSQDLFGVVGDGMPNVTVIDMPDVINTESTPMERSQSMCHLPSTSEAFSHISHTDYHRSLAIGSPELHATGSDGSYLEHSPDSGYQSLPQSPEFTLQYQEPSSNHSIAQGQAVGGKGSKKMVVTRRNCRNRRRRTPEQSKHLERWLETHQTAPGKEIQGILASESGLSVSQVKYWFKNELKNKPPGV